MFGWYKFVGEYEFILYVDVVVGYEGYLCDNGFVFKKKKIENILMDLGFSKIINILWLLLLVIICIFL